MKLKIKFYLILFILFNLSLYSQKEVTDSISYYNTQANANIKANNYKEVFLYTQKAINYAEEHSKIKEQAAQTAKLGRLYYSLKKYDDAVEKLTESINLFKSLSPSAEYAKAYYFLGLAYIQKNNFSAAEICISKTSAISKAIELNDNNESILLQKAIIYKANQKYDKAASILNSIISKPDKPGILDTKAEALYQMGLIEEHNNRNNLALNYFNKALNLNAKNENLDQKSNILLAISTAYEKMLDKSNAYAYLKLHLNLKESIAIANNEKLGINDYEAFKEKQREQNLIRLNKQKQEEEKTKNFSRLINYLSIALIVILSLLSFSLYRNNIIRKKSNLLLTEKNNELVKAKEKAEKASNARADFLSIVSHELRTPLNAINGITHLLLEENPKKTQLHYLSSLQYSGNYLTAFINDILEINKIDSNKIELEHIDFDIKQLLEDLQNSLLELATKNKNAFVFDIDPNIPNNLIGDPIKLSQIFMNLINNALKFTKNGKVTLTAKLQSIQDEKAVLYFEITDTGIGIPEEKLKTVFESFSQGSTEINRKYGGTGLGLTIVKKLLKVLGSDIHLKSTLGEGSVFSFELALAVNNNQTPVEPKQQIPFDISIIKGKKILVVEDNKINQMITKRMLENKEIICELIDNGEDAIEAVKNHNYDLVLMDVHLPGINGTIATQEIRKFNSITPIIAMTAISLNENRAMLLSYGMNDVITKPFIPDDFYILLCRYLAD
ncbi:Signal transduction histidine kinase [Flavobacterium flevense]|uniref:histidine kinase n=1 Tax=Flavobacterium flevense TaxID=983 RepID=A0A4Y4AXR4_9FLAO|nr:ATP-binding protein [Flavobacterium flevense]GEC71707.1 histidine kinase [Flavobacterium flevense]SHL26684.1 Signal transduction histidine kinase [Flavobacterium flevense]